MLKLNDLYNLINDSNLDYKEDISSLKIYIGFDKNLDNSFYIELLKKLREYTNFRCEISTTNTIYFKKENVNSPDNNIFEDSVNMHLSKLRKMNASFTYTIKIKKNFCWFISKTYLLNLFNNPLLNLEEISKIFSVNRFQQILICNYDKTFSNQFIKISNLANFSNEMQCSNSIDFNKFNNRFTNINLNFNNYKLIPEYFYFETNFEFDDLINCFNCMTIFISFLYLSNSCRIIDEDIKCIFNGKKETEVNFSYNDLKNISNLEVVTKNIYELYSESYSSNSFQSIAIVRNIISLFLRDKCIITSFNLLIDQSTNILKTFKNNLAIAALNDSDKYFANRYTVFDFISNSNDSISKVIDGLITKMNAFYLSTVSTLIASLLLFFKELNFGILKISLILYSIYIFIFGLMNFLSSYESFRSCSIIYDKKLTAFEKIFIDGELDDFKKMYNPKKKFYIYFYINLGLLIFILILCIIFIFNFNSIKPHLENLFSITPKI